MDRPHWHAEAIELRKQGWGCPRIAKRFGKGLFTVQFAVKQSLTAQGLPPRQKDSIEDRRRKDRERWATRTEAQKERKREQNREAQARRRAKVKLRIQ